MMRRVRSSKCGQTARNFCVKTVSLFMRAQHTALTVKLIPLFIYSALTRGQWPSVIGAWLQRTVSFMVWLLMGALSLTLEQDFCLSQADTARVVSLPLLSGAILRVVEGWSSEW